jgi:hypothetical protein
MAERSTRGVGAARGLGGSRAAQQSGQPSSRCIAAAKKGPWNLEEALDRGARQVFMSTHGTVSGLGDRESPPGAPGAVGTPGDAGSEGGARVSREPSPPRIQGARKVPWARLRPRVLTKACRAGHESGKQVGVPRPKGVEKAACLTTTPAPQGEDRIRRGVHQRSPEAACKTLSGSSA